jgi:ribosome-interacting GTPase 1
MKHARIWGAGRYDGQHVHKAEVLREGDIVELHE